MKKVMDKHSVAHAWANQSQDEARTATSNMYFYKDTIFSYGSHFPIAKRIEFNGKRAVLFTTRTYSVTTTQHITIVRQACNYMDIIYCHNPNESHADNLKDFTRAIERIAPSLTTARKPEKYLNEMESIADQARKYIEFFELTTPETLQAAMNIGDKEEYLAYGEKKRIAANIQYENEQKLLKKRHKEQLKKWMAGETSYLQIRLGHDYLRIKDGRIETSQHVQIPIEYGKKLYQTIKDNALKVGDVILTYKVLEVGKEIKVGCHLFTRKYLLEFGSKL